MTESAKLRVGTGRDRRTGSSGAGVRAGGEDDVGEARHRGPRAVAASRWAAYAALLAAALGSSPAVAEARVQAQAGPSVGYDGGFFIRSADGANLLRVNFVSQFRYVYNWRPDDAVPDGQGDEIGGWQYRRLQLDFRGNVRGPRWTYRLRLDASNGGGISAAWAFVGYQLTDQVGIRFGQFKPSFLHEENVGSTNQLAAERSYTADYFTTDFSQGVQAVWQRGRARLTGTLHAGSYGYRTDFNAESASLAVAGRGELVLVAANADAGWRRYGDFQSWSGAEPVVVLGVAGDYERGETFGSTSRPDVVKWTGDVVAKFGPVAVFGAVIAQAFDANDLTGALADALDDANQFGVVGQAAIFLVPDKLDVYGRYERIDFDDVYFRFNQGAVQSGSGVLDQDRLSIFSFGGNYYLSRHNAKLSLGAVVAADGVPVANTGQGLLSATDGTQWALQSQFQFTF